VLIDPQLRTIYDLYGVQGVESGQHLALYDMDRNKVGAEGRGRGGSCRGWGVGGGEQRGRG